MLGYDIQERFYKSFIQLFHGIFPELKNVSINEISQDDIIEIPVEKARSKKYENFYHKPGYGLVFLFIGMRALFLMVLDMGLSGPGSGYEGSALWTVGGVVMMGQLPASRERVRGWPRCFRRRWLSCFLG